MRPEEAQGPKAETLSEHLPDHSSTVLTAAPIC